jgi:LysM repeat protein
MSMNRRRTASYRRKRKGKGVPPQVIALGVAGVVGLGWFLKGGGADDVQPLPLSAQAQQVEVAGAEGPLGTNVSQVDDSVDPVAGQPPSHLVESFAQLGGDDPQALIDLRRLAVEFSGSQEAARATSALENERQRCLGRAEELKGDSVERLREEAAKAVWYSRTVSFGTETYAVESGDSLTRIARNHGSDYRMIQRFSGLKNDRIRVGQKLKIPTEPVQVVIFKRDFEVILLYAGCYLRSFDCATGKDDATPEGEFTIGKGKLVNPDWYAPDGKFYKYGTEGNVLGTRWLPFVNTPEHEGFGIHGTKFPESIGTEASMGCIRLRNADAEVVYDFVPVGSTVRIVR